ncbi:hypothetical protein FisN_3Hh373 [Fistulifera solaris]|jgi:hypothetical protein|uniref:SAGA-associated factor 11 n=1 Tax=Fistulifera solaris TaxID=1519565 RepID=A0A1Z5JQH5_FISSO|nr:hypothetical protein FisN_3Hh373 [Fistulifera solaris]|eukprot:GAX16146.1 hypothetical protein FisN_3Hh373 [Fistulifera solaris]
MIEEDKKSSVSVEESILLERMALYPGLYKSVDELKDDLVANGVEYVKRDTPIQYNIDSTEVTEPTTESDGIMTRQQTQVDIWGRLPNKEPETMIDCPLCKRLVNTLRFAPHLDKCMGIGTMSRASAPSR